MVFKLVRSMPDSLSHRPLIGFPSWDGKLVLAGIFIIGYYGLVFALVLGSSVLTDNKAGMVRDAMLTLGPPIGLIFGALFRTTAAEERREANRSAELQTAITTPSVVTPDPMPAQLGDQVERGAERGAARGVERGLDNSGNGANGDPTPVGTDIIE